MPNHPLLSWPATLSLASTILLLVGGCGTGADENEDTAAETRTVSAVNGQVEVPSNPTDIAVLWRPTLAAAAQLGHTPTASLGDPGAEDSALSAFLPDEAEVSPADITIVSNSLAEEDINLEELATTEPDLIIGVHTDNATQAELEEELTAIAPTVLLEWAGTESWRDHLTDVAEVVDAEDEATTVAADYEDAVAEARDAVEETVGDPAETEVSLVRLQSESEIRFETPAAFSGQIMADVGFTRPEAQLDEHAQDGADFVSESYENLDDGDGDLVFVVASGDHTDAPDEFGGEVWSSLDAVAEEQIFAMDFDYWGAASYPAAHRVLDDLTDAVTGEIEPAV